jgi:hypothetical protein
MPAQAKNRVAISTRRWAGLLDMARVESFTGINRSLAALVDTACRRDEFHSAYH